MKKINSKVAASVLTAIFMTVVLVVQFESAANSPLRHQQLQYADRENENGAGEGYQSISADASNAVQNNQDIPSVDTQAQMPAVETTGAEPQAEGREVVMAVYISTASLDDVDIFVWEEISRLSPAFDLDVLWVSSNNSVALEADEIRNAIREGFGLIIINPVCAEDSGAAISEAYEAGLVIGIWVNDLIAEFRDYRHFFVPFVGNVSGLLTFPEGATDAGVQVDLTRMVLSTFRSARSVLEFGYVNPFLVAPMG